MKSSNLFGLFIIFFYSLSPGLAKIFDEKNFFIIGILFLTMYFLPTLKIRKSIDFIYLYLVLIYSLGMSLILIYFDISNFESFTFGFFQFFYPFLLILISETDRIKSFLKQVPLVGLFHLILAGLIFPITLLDNPLLVFLSEKLVESAAAYRLASVSGSLAFSALMFGCLALSASTIYNKNSSLTRDKLLFVFFALGCVFSLQRAVWVSCLLLFFLVIFFDKASRVKSFFYLIALLLTIIFILMSINNEVMSELILDRLISIYSSSEGLSAIGERTGQWYNVFLNLYNFPFGSGIGQIGQSARSALDSAPTNFKYIVDGDYFRIISEFGFFGLYFVFIILWINILFVYFIFNKKSNLDSDHKFYGLLFLGLSIQLLGTNISEMYFVNVIYFSALTLMIEFKDNVKADEKFREFFK